MKACKDIDFLDSYWREAKRIAEDVKENLSQGCGEAREPIYNKGGIKMYLVNFSDLKCTWSPKDIIYGDMGKSETLQALSDKICHMIYKGRAEAIKRMVKAICNNNIKKLTKPASKFCKENTQYSGIIYKGDFLGYGHFRWNNRMYVLNSAEIQHLKKYFKI